MLSLTSNTLKPIFSPFTSTTTFLNPHQPPHLLHPKPSLKPISASIQHLPSSTPKPQPNQQVYQPFRPPPSPIPEQYRSLDVNGRLDILANRLGLWYEYAPLIPSLLQQGFTPPTIEEVTGISGVEQNRLVVAAQVRESLIHSKTDPEITAEFDTGGSELLYEIRLLSVQQRAAAARFIVEKRLDAKGAGDLARATKDFPRRRGDKGWESFDYTNPGDCLAFMYYRQAREHNDMSETRTDALEEALKVVGSEKARSVIVRELEGESVRDEEEEVVAGVKVPVVRLKFGEVGESSRVVVLPVCKAEEKDKEVMEAPWECESEGELGVVVAEKGWKRWVVLPGWEPVVGLGRGGVVVSFSDARVLPWKVNRWYKEEPILVVADRSKKEMEADDGFYLAALDGEGLGFKVERGSALKEAGVKESLGTVVVSFSDARVLPWKVNRWYKEEPILVVADRSKKEVEADDGFYLAAVDGEGLGFKVERGSAFKEAGVKESLGTVVLIVRPPKDDTENEIAEEDWE